MDTESTISALNNPIRHQILIWLKDRSNFPPPLPEHSALDGVCVGYIQDKAGLSQSTISTYMSALKNAGLVVSERHGQWTFYRRDEVAITEALDQLSEDLL